MGATIAFAGTSVPCSADEAHTKKDCAQSAHDAQRLQYEEKLLAARDALKVCARDSCPAVVAQDCRKWLAQLTPTIPSVVFFLQEPEKWRDGRIWIDGKLHANKLDGKPVMLDPGVHTLRFDVGTHSTTRKVVVVKGDRDRRIDVPLPPVPPPRDMDKPRPAVSTVEPGTPAFVYVLAGSGVVALSLATYFGMTGLSDRSDLIDTCDPRCNPDDVDATRNRLMAADIAGLVGLASLGGALWIYLDSDSGIQVGTSRERGATFGTLRGRF